MRVAVAVHVIVLCQGALPIAARATEISAAQEVESAERAWSEAFLRHDVAAISNLLAEGFERK